MTSSAPLDVALASQTKTNVHSVNLKGKTAKLRSNCQTRQC